MSQQFEIVVPPEFREEVLVREITEAQKKRLWDEVQAEFPNDVVMQEVHYVRLLYYHQTKDLSAKERVRFYNQVEKEPSPA